MHLCKSACVTDDSHSKNKRDWNECVVELCASVLIAFSLAYITLTVNIHESRSWVSRMKLPRHFTGATQYDCKDTWPENLQISEYIKPVCSGFAIFGDITGVMNCSVVLVMSNNDENWTAIRCWWYADIAIHMYPLCGKGSSVITYHNQPTWS